MIQLEIAQKRRILLKETVSHFKDFQINNNLVYKMLRMRGKLLTFEQLSEIGI